MIKEVGDTVAYARHSGRVPRHVRGEVIKASKATVLVRWSLPEPMQFWHRGRNVDVPETGRYAHHNLELVERKGGPW